MGNAANPEEQVVPITDPVLGMTVNAEFTTMRPQDHPYLDPLDPLIDDPAKGLRNLTSAEQGAGETPRQVYAYSKTITLMGGGVPGAIFSATINGKPTYEVLLDTKVRTLDEASNDAAVSIQAQQPELRCTASGTTVLVQSHAPITITAAAPPLFPFCTIWQGEESPLLGDTVVLTFGTNPPITVGFGGTENLPDIVLNKIYDALSNSPIRHQINPVPTFKNSYSRSNLALIFNSAATILTAACRGQIQLRMQPQNAGSDNYSFTVT
jgi:hypothetical protein